MTLAELLTHEDELLAREGPHVGVEGSQGRELLPVVTGDLVDHGSLAVHDLVMADRQDEVLRVLVHHGEGHLAVVILTMERIELHVAQGVVHPTHVPLEPESQAAVIDRLGDAGEAGRLLGNHEDAGVARVQV